MNKADIINNVYMTFLFVLISIPFLYRFAGVENFSEKRDYIVSKFIAIGAGWGFLMSYLSGEGLSDFSPIELVALICAGVAFHLVLLFFWKAFGAGNFNSASSDQHRRGQKLLNPDRVASMIRDRKLPSRFAWSGVPIPHGVETRSFLLAGSPGTGKSQALCAAGDAVMATDARGIIADPSASFLRRWSRDDSLIFNPFDQRGVDWSPFAEMEGVWDATSLAKSIIPDGEGSSAEWNGYAQTFVEALLLRLFEAGKGTNGELYRLCCIADIEELREIVAGTAATPLVAEGNERMFGSVRAIIGSYLKPYSYLNPNTGKDGFSVKDFVLNGTGWLFITYRQDQRDALSPLIGAVLDIASRALLMTKPDLNRRFFFMLDEFPLLGKVSSIVELLTNGRKHGAAAMIGIQTIAQLRSVYGREVTQTILACLGSWVVLRCNDSETAQYMASHAGKEEVMRTNESTSNSDSGKSTSKSQQVVTQDVLLPSEIQNWPDLAGVMNLAGDLPICRIFLSLVRAAPDRTEDFILRRHQPADSSAAEKPAEVETIKQKETQQQKAADWSLD